MGVSDNPVRLVFAVPGRLNLQCPVAFQRMIRPTSSESASHRRESTSFSCRIFHGQRSHTLRAHHQQITSRRVVRHCNMVKGYRGTAFPCGRICRWQNGSCKRMSLLRFSRGVTIGGCKTGRTLGVWHRKSSSSPPNLKVSITNGWQKICVIPDCLMAGLSAVDTIHGETGGRIGKRVHR